jgi:hypothetical protein
MAWGLVERVVDPGSGTIRERTWTETAWRTPASQTFMVDARQGTVALDDPKQGIYGSGTLTGKPWQWTALSWSFGLKGSEVSITEQIQDDRFHSTLTLRIDGKQSSTIEWGGTQFDCVNFQSHLSVLARRRPL